VSIGPDGTGDPCRGRQLLDSRVAADSLRLGRHPRFHVHFKPTYSSWLNLGERWFAKLTEQAPHSGSYFSTRELHDAIEG
jgi:hypothetical protein